MQFVPILVFGFAASLGLTPLSREIAMRFGVVDRPNQRKLHLDHKPLMGGFAIYVAFTLSLLLFSSPQHLVQLGAVLAGAAFLALVGLLDDRYELGIKAKLGSQILAAVMVIASGVFISLFKTPWLDYPLTVLWIVGLTNAVNFLDNMDGLTAGLSAIAGFFFMLIAYTEGLTLVSSLAAAVLGSAVGFLVYNFNPASTFMGDMGALVLGFVLAVLGIKLEFADQPFSVTWMVPLLVLALPLFDICLVVLTRLAEGRSPGEAGKDHTSHRLMSLGLSQRKTLFVLYAACLLFGTLGWLVSAAPTATAYWLGAVGLVLLAVLFALMIAVRQRRQLSR